MNLYKELLNALDEIENNDSKILIIGDLMLDRYLYGNVSRISPEAPIPVIHVKNEELKAGGAANVAVNIKSINNNIDLMGIIGNDRHGDSLLSVLENNGINTENIIIDDQRETTSKTRVIANKQQQVLRIDREEIVRINETQEDFVISRLDSLFSQKNYGAISISDYNKGFLTDKIAKYIVKKSDERNIPVLIDSKTKNYKHYKGAQLIKPNQKEASILLNIDNDELTWENHSFIKEKLQKLQKDLGMNEILVTRGEKGIYIYDYKSENNLIQIPAHSHSVYDVTGAGDVTMAWLSIAKSCNLDIVKASILAVTAASLSVTKLGVTTVDTNEVRNFYEKFGEDSLLIPKVI